MRLFFTDRNDAEVKPDDKVETQEGVMQGVNQSARLPRAKRRRFATESGIGRVFRALSEADATRFEFGLSNICAFVVITPAAVG